MRGRRATIVALVTLSVSVAAWAVVARLFHPPEIYATASHPLEALLTPNAPKKVEADTPLPSPSPTANCQLPSANCQVVLRNRCYLTIILKQSCARRMVGLVRDER